MKEAPELVIITEVSEDLSQIADSQKKSDHKTDESSQEESLGVVNLNPEHADELFYSDQGDFSELESSIAEIDYSKLNGGAYNQRMKVLDHKLTRTSLRFVDYTQFQERDGDKKKCPISITCMQGRKKKTFEEKNFMNPE